MFGYIRPTAQRETFREAYCGLCHTLGRRYGFFSRFLLNFDFTLLAMLLGVDETPVCSRRRCAAHPCRGCMAMAQNRALERAADRSVILFWWQLRDHVADSGFWAGLKYRLVALFLRGAYRKARAFAPAFDETVRQRLRELGEKESARCASLDEAAEPFAALLADVASDEPDETRRRILHQLFYHLGRWIYLIDAADDFKKDARSGNYNPLRYRYAADGDELPEDAKRRLAETLDASIAQMAGAYALLPGGYWTGVLDGIFYDSLYGVGKAVLSGVYRKPPRMRKTKHTEESHERSL